MCVIYISLQDTPRLTLKVQGVDMTFLVDSGAEVSVIQLKFSLMPLRQLNS